MLSFHKKSSLPRRLLRWTFWTLAGSLRFPDGTRSDAAIDYELDGEYPCRGNIRPRHDGVTRL